MCTNAQRNVYVRCMHYSKIAELSEMKEGILSRISAAVKASAEYRDSFSSYSHLWTDNRQEFLMQFLVYGHVPTQVFVLHKQHV